MSSESTGRGTLFVVSAPSGTGKTTLVEWLVARTPGIRRSVSYTSRALRPGEAEGVDYNFVSRSAFEDMLQRGAMLEWAEIYGDLYGTARRDVDQALEGGLDLVLVIDVQGAQQVREALPEGVGIFVLPPSFAVLDARLRGRKKDSEAAIALRLATARREVHAIDAYEYVVINDDLDRCVAELEAIVRAERARSARRRALVQPIVETFRE